MIARGCWQREQLRYLLAGWGIGHPTRTIIGRANGYVDRYQESLGNMIRRLEDIGYRVEFTPGPRGGAWGGEYRITRGFYRDRNNEF